MSVALIARADRRGLSTLAEALVPLLAPAKVLVIEMGKHRPFANTPGVFPDRWGTVAYDDLLRQTYDWSPFFEGTTTVLTFETAYDERFYDICRKANVHSVELVMPELKHPTSPRPDVLALPTTWRQEHYPEAVLLPIPADPLLRRVKGPNDGTVLHVAGSPAAHDRNATEVIYATIANLRRPRHVIIRSQHPLPPLPKTGADVTVEVTDREDRQGLYEGADLALQPRRYGGLSLPAQEAMSVGLGLVVGEYDQYGGFVAPWARLPERDVVVRTMAGGRIPCSTYDHVAAAAVLDGLDDDRLAEMRQASNDWAEAYSWENVKHYWEAAGLCE